MSQRQEKKQDSFQPKQSISECWYAELSASFWGKTCLPHRTYLNINSLLCQKKAFCINLKLFSFARVRIGQVEVEGSNSGLGARCLWKGLSKASAVLRTELNFVRSLSLTTFSSHSSLSDTSWITRTDRVGGVGAGRKWGNRSQWYNGKGGTEFHTRSSIRSPLKA